MLPTTEISSSFLAHNRLGVIPLPEESADDFLKRINALEFSYTEPVEQIAHLYDIAPSWVPVEYSNKGLRLWEAGCTWYGEDAATLPLIQLAEAFKEKKRYLGLYQKDEVLAHEYVHAVRAGLGSMAFEELFSYLVSFSFAKGGVSRLIHGFRVLFGPVFERTWEPLLLISLILLVILLQVVLEPVIALATIPIGVATIGLGLFFLGRLCLRWWQWLLCKRHLDRLLARSSLPLMVRLTDEEIVLFSQLQPAEIAEWIIEQGPNFRWQLLKKAYCEDIALFSGT